MSKNTVLGRFFTFLFFQFLHFLTVRAEEDDRKISIFDDIPKGFGELIDVTLAIEDTYSNIADAKTLVLIDVKNGGADVENVDEDSICDYYLTPYQDHFHSLATELNCFCCNCLGSFFGHKCDIGQHLQVLRCLIKGLWCAFFNFITFAGRLLF